MILFNQVIFFTIGLLTGWGTMYYLITEFLTHPSEEQDEQD